MGQGDCVKRELGGYKGVNGMGVDDYADICRHVKRQQFGKRGTWVAMY